MSKAKILQVAIFLSLAILTLTHATFAQNSPSAVSDASNATQRGLAKACNELLNAFDKGELYIKELQTENAKLVALGVSKDERISILERLADAHKGQAESYKKALEAMEIAYQAQAAQLALTNTQLEKEKKKTRFWRKVGTVVGGVAAGAILILK